MPLLLRLYLPFALLFFLGSCSNQPKPSLEDVQKVITAQVQKELASNQKLVDVDILGIGETGEADFEGAGSQNLFWIVKSQITTHTIVTKKRFLSKKKRIVLKNKPVERMFRVWKNKQGQWMATPFAATQIKPNSTP